jgi:hypothetical protein
MATEQLLLRLPADLVQLFKRTVPVRERSAFVKGLLEKALPPPDDDNDPIYLAALAVENDAAFNAEMMEWEVAAVADGLHELD